jgi:hypothetical protein
MIRNLCEDSEEMSIMPGNPSDEFEGTDLDDFEDTAL